MAEAEVRDGSRMKAASGFGFADSFGSGVYTGVVLAYLAAFMIFLADLVILRVLRFVVFILVLV